MATAPQQSLIRETPFQKTLSNKFSAKGGSAKTIDIRPEAVGIIATTFPAGVKPIVTVTSRVTLRDYAVDLSMPRRAPIAGAAKLNYFLRPTKLIPTDGIVKTTAAEITNGAASDAAGYPELLCRATTWRSRASASASAAPAPSG